MKDRELLELAARFGGIQILDWREDWAEYGPAWRTLDGNLWNSLVDDGDALRLAVASKIVNATNQDWVIKTTSISEYQRDPFEATRRAITLAAAGLAEV